MRFKIDENLPEELALALRNAGFDAVGVRNQGLSGATDPTVFSVSQKESRILVTLDIDFTDVRHYSPSETAGIIVLRLRNQSKPHVLGVFTRVLSVLHNQDAQGALWIVDEHRIRVHGKGSK